MNEVENPMVLIITDKDPVGVAFCKECQLRLFQDEEFLELDGDYFCDDSCLKQYLGIKTVIGSDVFWN